MTALDSDHIELVARDRLVKFGSCASCPVQVDCLTVALTFNEDHGIWGGLTATERRALAIAISTRNEVLDDLVEHAVCVPAG